MYLPSKKAMTASPDALDADPDLRRDREVLLWKAIMLGEADDLPADDKLIDWLNSKAPALRESPVMIAMREACLPNEEDVWEVRWQVPTLRGWQVDTQVRRIEGVLEVAELTIRLTAGRTVRGPGVAHPTQLFSTPSNRLWAAGRQRPASRLDNRLISKIKIADILVEVQRLIADEAGWRDLWSSLQGKSSESAARLRAITEESVSKRPGPGGKRPPKPDEFYRQVALIVLELQRQGSRAINKPLLEAMVERGGVSAYSARTPERWIKESRSRQFLAPHEGPRGSAKFAPGPALEI